MLTHLSISDENISKVAKLSAFVEKCMHLSLSSDDLSNAYLSASAQILTVSSYNNEKYAESYAEFKDKLMNETHQKMTYECKKFNEEGPSMIDQMINRYNSIASARKMDILNIAGSFSQINQPSFQSYNQSMQSIAPNVALEKPKTTNFLINSAQGYQLRRCTVTKSGMAICN